MVCVLLVAKYTEETLNHVCLRSCLNEFWVVRLATDTHILVDQGNAFVLNGGHDLLAILVEVKFDADPQIFR